MIRAWQASRRACSAVTRHRSRWSRPRSRSAGCPGRGDHHRCGGAAVGGRPVSGRFSRNATNASPRRRGDRQGVDLTERACVVVRCRRPGRCGAGSRHGPGPRVEVVDPSPRGVNDNRVAAWARAPRRAALVLGLVRDLRGQVLEDPAAEVTQLPRPNTAACSTRYASAFDDRRHPGRRAARPTPRRPPGLGQVQVTGSQTRPRSGSTSTPGTQHAACRRTVPWVSRVWVANHVAVDRSPVSSAMSSEAAAPGGVRLGPGDQPREPSRPCFSSVVRNRDRSPQARPTPARAGQAARRTCSTSDNSSPTTTSNSAQTLSTRDLSLLARRHGLGAADRRSSPRCACASGPSSSKGGTRHRCRCGAGLRDGFVGGVELPRRGHPAGPGELPPAARRPQWRHSALLRHLGQLGAARAPSTRGAYRSPQPAGSMRQRDLARPRPRRADGGPVDGVPASSGPGPPSSIRSTKPLTRSGFGADISSFVAPPTRPRPPPIVFQLVQGLALLGESQRAEARISAYRLGSLRPQLVGQRVLRHNT